MKKNDTHKGQDDAEMIQLIAQLRSNPSLELLIKAQELLRSGRFSRKVVSELSQAVSEIAQLINSAKAVDTDKTYGPFTPEQLKVIDSFYGSLNPLTKQIKEYKEALDKFELDMKVKEDKLKELNAEIAANPFSKLANAPRARRDSVIMDMIKLSAELEKHHSLCQDRLDAFKAKRAEIENDKTLTPKQREELIDVAEREIKTAETKLKIFRGKVEHANEEITENLDKALCDKIAAEVSFTKNGYEQIVQKSFSDTDKTKIVNFVKDVVNSKDIDKDYELFTDNFVYRVAKELREPTVENETKAEGTKHRDRVRDSTTGINKLKNSKSFTEKEEEKKEDKQSKKPQNTR